MTEKEIETLKELLKKAAKIVWRKHYDFFHKSQNMLESDCTSKFNDQLENLEMTLNIPFYEEYLKGEDE